MNSSAQTQKGFTLVEVMAALAIMGVSLLALTGGIVIAYGANGRASRRTQMVEFAQSRIERLSASTRADICTATFQGGVVNCAKMSVSGTFDPNAAPGTGGWMLDVMDRAPYSTTAPGNDVMAGPLVVLGDTGGAVDETATLSARAALVSEWGPFGGGGAGLGCASLLVGKNMLCRELHIELDPTSTFYHIWVRVIRGQNYLDGPVVMEGMVAK